jgi:uncharacterized protein YecE (DUF72 family)
LPENLPLFPAPEPEIKSILAARLQSLARRNIFIGTSSWKYPGWIGEIYSPHRYPNNKRFEAECLSEYAETFPIVCGDFAFYQFPSPQFWQKLFALVPESFRFAFKAPQEITIPRLSFLNAELFQSQFLDLLLPYAARVPLIIFEFGAMSLTMLEFLAVLKPFLAKLPPDFRYAIEIRNPEFLDEPYLELLRGHGIAHVFNAWTRMPPLLEQLEHPGVFTSPFTVTRALLTPGRTYEAAVQTFSPYNAIKEPNHAVRDALRQVLVRAKLRAEPTYLFVNNRLEGFAPGTIQAVTEDF